MNYPEKNKTIISIESNGYKHTSELPWDAGAEDLFDAFIGLGVCATYSHMSLLRTFYEKSRTLLEIYYPQELNDE